IRGSRDRFKKGDTKALDTLHKVLVSISKLLAPYMPFLAEEMYQNLVVNCALKGAKDSVHLEDYPKTENIDEELLAKMSDLRSFVTLGLKVREDNGMKLRQPLEKAYVNMPSDELAQVLANELNVKSVECVKKVPEGDNYKAEQDRGLFVALDINLSEELEWAGFINEFARKIQVERKSLGLDITDRVSIHFASADKFVKNALESSQKDLLERVGASEILYNETLSGEEIDVNSHMVTVTVTKV
ncbi:class I tRNA ligase family protein, partial [Candidatus Dojkabacteria bacterium]|nr:class I tRNA ligase family protein [Candidatus Dojkabacteria bacterium]